MAHLKFGDPEPQAPIAGEPHDRWLAPGGKVVAEFYRTAPGYLVRFPGQVEFAINLADLSVVCTPTSHDMREIGQSQFHNAIEPLIGNFCGGLFLHGSAVSVGGTAAVAILGESRRGKTTLAGAFARAGHPFLSEDTVELMLINGQYQLQPSRPILRLFHDSAAFLLGQPRVWAEGKGKKELPAGPALPFTNTPAPLAMICLLGPGECDTISLMPMRAAEALSRLCSHAFILDVDDREKLRGHFDRLGALAENVPCLLLDYPRRYDQLPGVIDAIVQRASQDV